MRTLTILALGSGCVMEGGEDRGELIQLGGRATQIGDEGLSPSACPKNIDSVYTPLSGMRGNLSDLARPYIGSFDIGARWMQGGQRSMTLDVTPYGRGSGFAGVGEDCDAWAVYEMWVDIITSDGVFDEWGILGQLQFEQIDGRWQARRLIAVRPVRELQGSFRGRQGELELVITGQQLTGSWPSPGRLDVYDAGGANELLATW